ncbi:MAG: hypothetical protein ACN6QR_05330, partial [Pseudomonas protegens]
RRGGKRRGASSLTQTKLSGYAIDSQALLFDLRGFYDGRLLAKGHSFAIIAAIIFCDTYSLH